MKPIGPALGFLAVAAMVAGPALADESAGATPEPLKPFIKLVDQCRQWHSRLRNTDWQVAWKEPFGSANQPLRRVNRYGEVVAVDGKPSLVVTPPTGGTAFVPVGPKLKGEFAIEMVARATVANVPLSIMLDEPRGVGPGFQFSTRNDEQHFLWVPTPAPNPQSAFRSLRLGTEPRQEANRRYTVRLEVRKTGITGYIDGKRIGSSQAMDAYDWARLRQPHVMTVLHPIVVESFRIETPAPTPADHQAADVKEQWKRLFGDATADQVAKRIRPLVGMLDHESWTIRETAGRMLRDAGELAVPALRQAVGRGSAELDYRVELLLRALDPDHTPSESISDAGAQPTPAHPFVVRTTNAPVQLQQIQIAMPIRRGN